MTEFQAYKRPSGKIGIRNHVLVISPVSYTNRLAKNISNQVEGLVPIYSQYGRNLKGSDKNLHNKTLVGVGKNPNVGAILVLGWESKQMNNIADEISSSGKPVKTLRYLDNGIANATSLGVKESLRLKKRATQVNKKPASTADLLVGIECGGSDTTSGIISNPVVGKSVDHIIDKSGSAIFSETVEIIGAEDLLADRAASSETANKLQKLVNNVEQRSDKVGYDINDRNPVGDNVEGGITTIEEKSIGAITKSGSKPIEDVLQFGESPVESGLFFMDTPAAAQQSMAGLIAAGVQLIIFSTGKGNPAGTPITPVLKISGNPNTITNMGEHIDVDISDILNGKMNFSSAEEVVKGEVYRTVEGKRTSSELLKHQDFAPKREGRWIID